MRLTIPITIFKTQILNLGSTHCILSKPVLFSLHPLNLNLNHAQPVYFPFFKFKRFLLSIMFGQNGKPLYFLIVVFQKLCLPVPDDTPVTDIIFADII